MERLLLENQDMMVQPPPQKSSAVPDNKYLGTLEDYSFLMLDPMQTTVAHHASHPDTYSKVTTLKGHDTSYFSIFS